MNSDYVVYERIFYSIIGDYCYITNRSGSKQGLFSKNVSIIIDLLNETDSISIPELVKKLNINRNSEAEASLNNVLNDLSSAGFFSPPTDFNDYHPMDPSIRERLNRVFSRNPVPLTVDFEITSKCNLRCVHCYNSCTYEDVFLPLDRFKEYICELKSLGTLFIGLSGGEPLLHPDLLHMIDFCDQEGLLVTILTNGTLLSEDFLTYIQDKSVQVLKISLYSSEPKEHDTITTIYGSHNKSMNNILKYSKQFPVVLQCPVMNANKNALAALREWAKTNRIPINFSLSIIAKSDGSMANINSRLSLTDYKECQKELGINNIKRYFPEDDDRRLCYGGLSSLAVSVAGDLYLCPLLKIRLNSYGECISETWSNSLVLNQIRQIKRNDFARCNNCSHIHSCRVCLADNYNETGDLYSIPDYTCHKRCL